MKWIQKENIYSNQNGGGKVWVLTCFIIIKGQQAE